MLHRSMIIGFRHKGLETLYKTGSARGVQAAHAPKLSRILAALNAAASPAELNQLERDAEGALVDMGKWQLEGYFPVCRS